jgi:hypothetical protein
MTDQLKINLTPFTYPQLTEPQGYLPDRLEAQACWYYYTLAQSTKELVGNSIDDQIILEGQEWMSKRYESQAWAVAKLYGLKDPGEFLKFAKYVWAQAKEMGLPEPATEYMNPIRGSLIT